MQREACFSTQSLRHTSARGGEYRVRDADTTRSSSTRHAAGGLRKLLLPRVLIAFPKTLAIGCGAFLISRRWLIGSLLITGVLLALAIRARPTPHSKANVAGDP